MRKERSLILLQEEMLWIQKSRVEWLKFGDSNTRFFHTFTVIRRRRNKIHSLLDNKGVWVERKEELKNMAVEFFSKLFRSNDCRQSTFIMGTFPTWGWHNKMCGGRW